MFNRFRDIFNKIDFDTESRGVGAYEYHYVLRFFLILNGIFFNNKTSICRLFWPVICLFTCIIGNIMMGLNMYYSMTIRNIPEFSESLAYAVTVTMTLVQQVNVLATTGKVHKIVELIEVDFKEMDTASKSRRKIFYGNQLSIWKGTFSWMVFAFIVIFAFGLKAVLEILHQQLYEEYNELAKRPLLFQMWLPFTDVYQTPLYELFLILSYIALFVVFTIYGAYIAFFMQFVMHTLGQFDLILLSFEELFDFNDTEKYYEVSYNQIIEDRFVDIVRRHQRIFLFCDRISNVIGPTLLNQVTLTSVVLCICGFQIAESLEKGSLHILFFLLFWASLIQLYIPCNLGSRITERASTIGDACYSCGWETKNITKSIARNIQIFILRCNVPLKICGLGMVTISLETFSSIVSTAGSYFTMLRQVNDEV